MKQIRRLTEWLESLSCYLRKEHRTNLRTLTSMDFWGKWANWYGWLLVRQSPLFRIAVWDKSFCLELMNISAMQCLLMKLTNRRWEEEGGLARAQHHQGDVRVDGFPHRRVVQSHTAPFLTNPMGIGSMRPKNTALVSRFECSPRHLHCQDVDETTPPNIEPWEILGMSGKQGTRGGGRVSLFGGLYFFKNVI